MVGFKRLFSLFHRRRRHVEGAKGLSVRGEVGTLHHVIVRGVEKHRIIADSEDRDLMVTLWVSDRRSRGGHLLCL
ncbi:MAG: hypothetical protein M8357_11155 [Desulfobulbaceae bacterium]|nr:hypothetical protein [Desulfobulbaceae bacterium]